MAIMYKVDLLVNVADGDEFQIVSNRAIRFDMIEKEIDRLAEITTGIPDVLNLVDANQHDTVTSMVVTIVRIVD